MSDTPRTDAETFDYECYGDAIMERVPYCDGSGICVDVDLSRQLEKELNATTAELERTKEQLRVAREALTDARKQFSYYAQLNFAQYSNLGDARGRQNELMAEKMRDALKALAQSNPDKEEPNVPLE